MNRRNNFLIFFLISCCIHLVIGYILLVRSSFYTKIEEPKIVSLELIQIDNVTNQTGTKHKSSAFNQSKPSLLAKNLPGHNPIKGFRPHHSKQLLNNSQTQNKLTENNSTRIRNNPDSNNIRTQPVIQQSQMQQSSQTQAPPKKISPFAAKAQEFEQKFKQNTNNLARKQSFSTRKSVNIINNISKNNTNHNKSLYSSEVKRISPIAARAKEFEQKSKNNSQDNSTNARKENLQHKPIPQAQPKIDTQRASQDSQASNTIPDDVKANISTKKHITQLSTKESITNSEGDNKEKQSTLDNIHKHTTTSSDSLQLANDANRDTKTNNADDNKNNSTFEHNATDAEKNLYEPPVKSHEDNNIKQHDDHKTTPQPKQEIHLQQENQIKTEQLVTKSAQLNTKVPEAEQTQATNTEIAQHNDANTVPSAQNVSTDKSPTNHESDKNAVTELDTNELLLKSEIENLPKIDQDNIKLVKNVADTITNSIVAKNIAVEARSKSDAPAITNALQHNQFGEINNTPKINNNSKQQLLTSAADDIKPDMIETSSLSDSKSDTDIIAIETKHRDTHSVVKEKTAINKDSGLVISNSNTKTVQPKEPPEQQHTKRLNIQQTNKTNQAIVKKNIDAKLPNSNRVSSNVTQKPLPPTPSSGDPHLPYSDSGPFHKLDTNSDNSISYVDTIRTQIQTHWNHTIGAVPGISVILRLTLQPDGNIQNIEEISARCPGNNKVVCKAFIQSTKRSIWAAAPLQKLPVDKYELWKQLTFEFAPESY